MMYSLIRFFLALCMFVLYLNAALAAVGVLPPLSEAQKIERLIHDVEVTKDTQYGV